jgi:Lipase (class 3)
MDYTRAIQFGLLAKAVEDIPPANLANTAGQNINISYGEINVSYKVISTFYGNDLATDLNPGRALSIVSFGLILQAPNGDIVVSVRGTDGIWEWIHDADFLVIDCPFLAGAGQTDDGFTSLYQSLRMTCDTKDPACIRLVEAIKALASVTAIPKLTICGHSLGASLATLLALDVASNTPFKTPEVFTYASPRTGTPLFASTFNQVVPNSLRIAHRVDIVPKLPLPPMYGHVNTLNELNSLVLGVPPKLLVQPDIACAHHLTTYLYLLSLQSGGPVLPLNPQCVFTGFEL